MPENTTVYQLDLHISPVVGAGVYVRSKDLPGLHLVGPNFRAMKASVETAIKRLFLDNRGMDVRVVWVADVAQLSARRTSAQPQPERIAVYPVKKAA